MTTLDYLRVLRARWVTLVVVFLVFVLGGLAYFVAQTTEYTARATLYVASQGDTTTTAAYQGNLLSQQRVKSYLEIVESTRVSSQVVNQLHLADSPSKVASEVEATSAQDSSVIELSVTDPDPTRAAEIANVSSTVFSDLVSELERPLNPAAVPPLVIRVIEPATVPGAPSSIGLQTVLIASAVLGLIAGLSGAILRERFDTSVKSVELLRESSGVANLAVIGLASAEERDPATTGSRRAGNFAESFKQLRNNLQFVDVDNPPQVIAITSSFPGEGKTSSAAHLAISMAAAGQRVVVIEADLRRPSLSDLFGLERSVGLTTVLAGRLPLNEAIQRSNKGYVSVLASGKLPPNPNEILGSRNMKRLLDELRQSYDMVIVDTPPLLAVNDAAALAPSTDGVVVLCRFNSTKRPQLATSLEALAAVKARILGTILTMVPSSGVHSYMTYRSYYGPDVAASDKDQAHRASRVDAETTETMSRPSVAGRKSRTRSHR